MSYLLKLTEDMKKAMKSKEKDKLTTIRMIITDLNNEKIKLQVAELNTEQEEVVLNRFIKKLDKEIEAYAEVSKDHSKQDAEKALILSYLPKKLTEEEIVSIIEEVIYEVDAVSKSDMGKVMTVLKQKFGNNADMGFVSKTVNSKLS
ncbi:tRNA amidotransferase [Bacillus phage G]|uniref:Gp509 n=1 Tax=Bacillus phage G TaxID=2884420 RepID=G3MAQ0_9CAUD|nr:tRNA amidotransferase [Bacillus phage G]AEO93767.1 gp509 [Bacillus phage G]